MRRRGIWLIGGLIALAACLAGMVWATRPDPPPEPDWSAEYDLTARHPGEIPPGTVVGNSPPSGWSHLILKNQPRVRVDQRAALLDFAADKAAWMFTAVVANVVDEAPGRYRLRAVGLGLGASINGQDTILAHDTGDEIADLDFVEREILTKGYAVQRKAVMVMHGSTFGILDTPLWYRCGEDNRLVRYRYALLVGAASGRLDVLLWKLDPEDASCGDVAEIVRLEPSTVAPVDLVVDPRKVKLGLPLDDAFAVDTLPPGKRLPFPPDLRPSATRTRLTPDEAHALEVRLRNLIRD